ncbi:STAS domain-containing protein [Solirubrobacter deserti]|uniref:STAS domain-containing protein n=1 Tax=Solirubrobacter deserti TaxID=2282478 RepID=A0ABT4RDL8_9ACTN|nr:STAS domain-containing protein [Solirubrobacter deserti]MDA0136612.1 STAS domain-containing protein [Solirubrobacter deserti]
MSEQAAAARASGRLNADAALELADALDDALEHARLVLLELQDVSAADAAGLDAIISRSARARQDGSRLLVIAAPPHLDAPLRLAGVELLTADPDAPTGSDAGPPANAVNARVVPGRVMSVDGRVVWLHAADGQVHRAWAPEDVRQRLRAQTWVDLFLDERDRLNGWYEAQAGMAINQRLAEADTTPETGAPVACQGECGVVWQAAAPARLLEHHERCLTCAGALVPG